MNNIGLAGWSNHPTLAKELNKTTKYLTLAEYDKFFNIVEVDNTFYRLQSQLTIKRWTDEVPNNFQFLVKANYMMTKHFGFKFGHPTEIQRLNCFKQFKDMIIPMVNANKLTSILFQFPPSFKFSPENIQYLNQIRILMNNLPLAAEFRNPSWFTENNIQVTKKCLIDNKITQVIVDEPHNDNKGVPLVPIITTPNLAYIRLHGENYDAWMKHIGSLYNYNYSNQQLDNIAQLVKQLDSQVKEVAIIFNNTVGSHGVKNAEKLINILNKHNY